MANVTDFAARGKVIAVDARAIKFVPAGTSYELSLAISGSYSGPIGAPVEGVIRAKARKVITVSSGGNFITPIFGPPKIVQGGVKFADERMVVIHAGCPVVIDLPGDDLAVDLNEGRITVGHMLNATLFAGANFELVTRTSTVELVK
jgi:hypothetical protein